MDFQRILKQASSQAIVVVWCPEHCMCAVGILGSACENAFDLNILDEQLFPSPSSLQKRKGDFT